MSIPIDLIAAFRAMEAAQHLTAILVDDNGDRQRSGFDALTIRVLGSWQLAEHRWMKPKQPQPDSGRPTPKAWAWLWSGYRPDFEAIASGAGISTDLARERFTVLKHNRLIYPDGTMSKWLSAAVTTHVAKRLESKDRKKKDKDKTTENAN